jgi:preprotein translocase subunit SecB
MQIQFVHIQFTEVSYSVQPFNVEPVTTKQELNIQLHISNSFSDENKRAFYILFDIALNDKSTEFQLAIKAVAHFTAQEDIEADFKHSSFITVNAPAIAFPYIRTFISNFTLNSGYSPVILPTFNFVELAENQ